ncbi:MAG TPA: hypothetical protein VMO88_01460 [Acidimicrobiales bacterium]|nr:hypothetical protein [Acidimicrobiales bacterium]
MASDELLCSRCTRPVRVSAAEYETFERMHYGCFHYEFEHDPADPDEECTAGGCPSGAIVGGREAAAVTAKELAVEARGATAWENTELPSYLEALGAWLSECVGFYANQRRVRPSNAWVVIRDAMRAATIYE